MQTRRDGIELKEKFERVEQEAFLKARRESNRASFVLFATTVGCALLGWFVLGPLLRSLS